MDVRRRPRARPPLDRDSLEKLAVAYVGRFATTRSRLAAYLGRKVRERGWAEPGEPPVDALVDRCAGMGFVDDSAYALAQARSLSGRGYGRRRLQSKLRSAGVADADSQQANALAETESVESALRFARRRRIGPFAASIPERAERERALAAMIRAGHPFGLARAIVDLGPGETIDPDSLAGSVQIDAP